MRQILEGMCLEFTAIVKNLSSLLIAHPSGVKPKLELLMCVTTYLRLLDHGQRDLICIPSDVPADKIPTGMRNVVDMDFLDISIVL